MKFKYIDSIRGIAILMVIAVHTGQLFQNIGIAGDFAEYGQLGVQLFFVASAFTLCLSATNRTGESMPHHKYAIRRFFRIAPLYYFGILMYGLASFTESGLFRSNISTTDAYTGLSVLSNVFFLNGFYPPGNNSIVPGGWSIGTEMAFYVLFPVIFYLVKGKLKGKYINYVLLIVASLLFVHTILGSAYFIGLPIHNNGFIYFNIITQLPVFIVGIVYYFYLNKFNDFVTLKSSVVFFSGFTLLTFYLFQSEIGYLSTVFPFTAAISFVFLMEIFRKVKGLNSTILAKIGQASYAMYIVHTVVIYKLLGMIIYKYNSLDNVWFFMLSFIIVVTLTYAFSKLLERFIEKPGINLGKRLIERLDSKEKQLVAVTSKTD